jgi:hypothetical protein
VATDTATGGGALDVTHVDWSVGYASHDGFGVRSGGAVYTATGES